MRVNFQRFGVVRPTLKRGDSGPDVETAQKALIVAGYRGPYGAEGTRTLVYLTPDSQFGPTTEQAVIKFNADKLMRSSNIIDQAVWDALPFHLEPPAADVATADSGTGLPTMPSWLIPVVIGSAAAAGLYFVARRRTARA